MHKKHADKGLVVIGVALDPPKDKGMVKEANDFLRKMRAPFRNFLLDEADELWSKKLDFTFPPCYFVFDRQGKWVRFRGSDYDDGVPYDEMDKVVLKMLSEK